MKLRIMNRIMNYEIKPFAEQALRYCVESADRIENEASFAELDRVWRTC